MSLRKQLLSKVGVPENDEIITSNLLKRPQHEKNSEHASYKVGRKNALHQCDILYLPDDDGYKYLFVVIDVATRLMDCRKLTDRTASQCRDAIKSIYTSKKYITFPMELMHDDGSEFKGVFDEYVRDNGVSVIVPTLVGKKQIMAVVEWANKVIGECLNRIMFAQEYIYHDTIKWWTDSLEKVVVAFNEVYKRDPIVVSGNTPPVGNDVEVLTVGTRVRVMLYRPELQFDQDYKLDKSKFRVGDQRWDKDITRIRSVRILPGQPVLYRVEKYPTGPSFTRKHLQLVPETEFEPDPSILTKHIPERIIEKRRLRGKVQYLVKWRGFELDRERDWVDHAELKKENQDLITEFNRQQRNT
jgi:hypothetical protein